MPCSMAGFPVPHYPPKFTQTHGHWVSDAIYLTHPLSPSFLAFNLSQHQVCLFVCLFFKWVGFSHQGAKILELHLQHLVLPMNIQGWFPLGWTGCISLQSKGLTRIFSNTMVQKLPILQCSAFFIVQLSHPYMTTGKTIDLTRQTFVGKLTSLRFNMLCRLS